MAGYPQNPSGYGQPSPYGPPPPGPQQPYAAQPQSHGQSPYAPVAAPYGAPSAPYGAPHGEKPHKEHKPTPAAPYGAPTPAAPYGAPTPASPYGAPTPAGPYGAQQPQHSTGYPPAPAAPYGSSPFASLMPSAFPPGTDPNVVSCFQMADRDRSGFIDDKELQSALSGYNQGFSLRTVHLLMYLFTNTNTRQIGPKEFTSVFYSLQSWRSNFEKFDRDRSGKIDTSELRDALASLGFSVSPIVLDLLVSKFDKSGGHNKAIEYDNFIECCLTVKGLTEKFKERDTTLSGNASFTYESFMLTVLPFLIA